MKAIEQWKELKGKYEGAVVVVRVGDNYVLYDEDAKKAAGLLGISLRQKEGGYIAGFPGRAIDKYLPILIKGGCRVAIVDLLGGEMEEEMEVMEYITSKW